MESDLFAHLMTRVEDYGIPTLYPGSDSKPPATGPWLEVWFRPNETQTYGWSGVHDHIGHLQLSVCHRPSAGLYAGLVIAEDLISLFPYGLAISTARLQTPYINSVLQLPDRIEYPVIIPYRAVI